ncbi:DegT/DnrJ/EryC1/StrS family aminotransferase [Winogradskyella sediminis]|uniref:dTDP-4-amino-4,6-dideoxygalactose transaminase n=1 Tax=Winogradskyella sediminis TaxID=1382466 RepID=A0A1H1VI25_9FLAO|nr:DegT/DnrJ/EryC1/StrS family aminotransferase [Winogradskyella sediminis]REG87712.1 dTDP-4-amino-4,6-dideoxygalactose transaminase [Winogradskyella sediminis]SDS83739.1 dTDP-4-amino-4,6-dideoxygalactose transaminase [Winogradskyella sediminis]
MINVTKTFLPAQDEYQAILKKAWGTGWMTNRGVLVKELETKLQSYLDTPNIIAMTNGTLPLQIAIKALGLHGEIITTPFSYVATTSSIVWEGCTPVFIDINPKYLTIDETKIEAAITSKTTAILATHVFGNPCNVEAIAKIAEHYNLKVIYDAAHCFGVTYKGQSLFNYGDVSTCSFHATKLFHTGEGGALFCKPQYFEAMYSHHNFGHDGPEAFQSLGINAKMSEPQAAMGLAILPYMTKIIKERKQIVHAYNQAFGTTRLKSLKIRVQTNWNYSYYPVIFENESQLLHVKEALESHSIYPRRYFYPSLNTLPYIKPCSLAVSESIASTVLCLPLFAGLATENLNQIINIVKEKLL